MTTNTISIVTPSYNQATYIKDALDSVKHQTHPAVEHIVKDGDSTDETTDILRRYEGADGYHLDWTSEPDQGQSDAINKGFDRASGDIVAWLNSDDVYFDMDVLSRVASYFDRFEADIIYGDLAYIDSDSIVTAVDVRPEFDRRKLPYRILIGQPATFFRRKVVDEEPLDTELDYSMDYEYWLRLSKKFEFLHVNDVLAGFRSYPEQKSKDQEAMAAELEDILTRYADLNPDERSVVLDNVSTEIGRLLRALQLTYDLHRNPPELAFDGEFAPFSEMVFNLGPRRDDVAKAWRRWRSKGESG